MKALYIDTSAACKQLRLESESHAFVELLLRARTDGVALTSSMLLDVELARVAVRDGYPTVRVAAIAKQFTRRLISPTVVAAAAAIPFHIRSLDAIHLATATALADDLVAIVAYDHQLIRAAEALGLPTVRPGVDEKTG